MCGARTLTVSRPLIRNRQARWLLLHRQGLGAPPAAPAKSVSGENASRDAQHADALLELIERIGFVQIDSIRTVERAHHMILFARNPRYQTRHLTTLLEQDHTLFENWTHDASVIPSRFHPYWQHRFNRERERLLAHWQKYRPRGMADVDATLAAVRARGELRARDLAPAKPAQSKTAMGWGDWHPGKAALEYLWRIGELAVVRREGFQKVYDLSERVIPAQFNTSPKDDVVDWAMNAALERLGVASSGELAAFFALVTPLEARTWVTAQLAKSKHSDDGAALIEVDVEAANGSRPFAAVARADLLDHLEQLPAPPKRLRVLSPFDPVLRDRTRMQRLFGFDYRIEIFVPAAQRKYGYYVFPLLAGERLVGRIDMHRDRARDALVVKALWWEAGIRPSKARRQTLQAELERMRRFTGMHRIIFEDAHLRTPA
ncbi:MAG: hypothetical protein ACI8W7_001622 [Gammaproteobacteria bacterium]|jgi:uncharacterized protein YcaQ